MASYRYREPKQGEKYFKPYYEIQISRGRGQKRIFKRWYAPEGKAEKTILKELNAYIAELERQAKANELVTKHEQIAKDIAHETERAKAPTVNEYAKIILDKKHADKLAPTTIQYYEFIYNGHIAPLIGDYKLIDVTPLDISTVLNKMKAANYSYSAIRGAYIFLGQIFGYAYTTEIINRNPVKKEFKPHQSKNEKAKAKSKSDDDYITPDELEMVFELLEHEDIKWQLMVHLLYDCGLRRGELCALKWNDINLKSNTINVHASVNATAIHNTRTLVYCDSTKSGETRTVSFSKRTKELLSKYGKSIPHAKSYNDYIFYNESVPEQPIEPTSINKFLSKFSKVNNIRHLHPHSFRHTICTDLHYSNTPVIAIQGYLGHADLKTTMGYSHTNDDENIKVIKDAQKVLCDK